MGAANPSADGLRWRTDCRRGFNQEVQVLVAELCRTDGGADGDGRAGGRASGRAERRGRHAVDMAHRRAVVGQLLHTRHGDAAQHARLDAAMA